MQYSLIKKLALFYRGHNPMGSVASHSCASALHRKKLMLRPYRGGGEVPSYSRNCTNSFYVERNLFHIIHVFNKTNFKWFFIENNSNFLFNEIRH